MSRQATFPEVLKAAIRQGLSDIYTSLPGIIVTVREQGKEQYVDVQPSLNIISPEGQIVERPVILNVPLQQFASSQGGLLIPVRVGDPCWLHFSMRGLDVWKRSNGRPSTPTDDRRFDINDCYATMGVVPKQLSLQDQVKHKWEHDTNDIVLVHGLGSEEETEIRFHVSGGISINTNQEVEVNAKSVKVTCPVTEWNGDINLNGNLNVSGYVAAPSVRVNGIEQANHVHTYTWTAGAGTSNTTGPIGV